MLVWESGAIRGREAASLIAANNFRLLSRSVLFGVGVAVPLFCGLPVLAPAARCAPQEGTSTKADSRYAEGAAALSRGDLAEARKAFEAIVKGNPSDAKAQNLLGMILFSQGETKSALAHLRTAVRLNPGSAEAHRTLSTALLQTGDTKLSLIHI